MHLPCLGYEPSECLLLVIPRYYSRRFPLLSHGRYMPMARAVGTGQMHSLSYSHTAIALNSHHLLGYDHLEYLLLASDLSLRYDLFVAFRIYDFHHVCKWIGCVCHYLLKQFCRASADQCYSLLVAGYRQLQFSTGNIPEHHLR